MLGNRDPDAALQVWLQQALSTKQRKRRTGGSPYNHVPTILTCDQPVAKRYSRAATKKASVDEVIQPRQQQGAEIAAAHTRNASIPRASTSPGLTINTPTEKRRRGVPAMTEGGQQQGRVSRLAKRPGTAEAGRMSAADLAAKKLLLPFIDELSFIEISLAERGNPSGVGLAPSNTVAKDAMELFQSSYLYTEGLDSLGKATRASSSRLGSSSSPSRTRNGASGTTSQARGGAGGVGSTYSFSSPSSSARRDISCKMINGALTRKQANGGNGSHSAARPGRGNVPEAFPESGDNGKEQGGSTKIWKRYGNTEISEPQWHSQPVPVCKDENHRSTSPERGIGGYHGGDRALGRGEQLGSTSSENIGGVRLASGSPDIGAVLRRYPQFCTFMGISSKMVVGLSPKYHPPGWTLRLCEEVLDDCWKAAEETRPHAGAGGTDAAYRSAQHAVAGAEGRPMTQAAPIDLWCLAQAKDLHVLEKGERDDNREQRVKRRKRRRRQALDQSDQPELPSHGHQTTGRSFLTTVSDLNLPKFTAAALSGRFGVRAVALQASLDLLFSLETLRPSFPELEHFSLVLRELHDAGALALTLHTRTLVSRLGGLRLVDIRHRWAGSLVRPPLRKEVVVLPHPALPAVAAQPWLTRKGCLAAAFLLLEQGGGSGTRQAKMSVLQDAKHLVAMARTAVSPGVDEPPPPSAASSERDAARELAAPMDHNQQEGSVSRQTDHVECPDRSTSTTYVDYSGGSYGDEAGAASTVSTPSGGGDSHRLGADSMVASSSEENKREVRTASSAAHGRSGKEGGCSGSSSRPYIPLHGFVSFICDLHMKTPQEILEKVNESGKGGGLGALETLAEAVEQERRRQELSSQLEEEARYLDAIGAEVLCLECSVRCVARDSQAGGTSGGGSAAKSAQAQVALTLKIAANRRQREVVETLQSEVERADKDVAASWQNVMTPPTSGTTSNIQSRAQIAGAVAPAVAPHCGNASVDTINSDAAAPTISSTPYVTAGDGLTETDAADLNLILEEVGDSISGRVTAGKTNHSRTSFGGGGSGKHSRGAAYQTLSSKRASPGSAGSAGKGSSCSGRTGTALSVRNAARSSTCSAQSSVAGESRRSFSQGAVVSGSMPLRLEPGPAARKALRTLRMYVHRLRVTKDQEDSTIDIEWREKVGERKVAAAVAVQRWMRRVWRDRVAIRAATLQATALRYARGKAKRHAMAEEERQVLAAREVDKTRQRHLLQEKEAVEKIVRSAVMREVELRHCKAKAKIQAPIVRRWRNHVRAEIQIRSLWRRRLQGFIADWKAWIGRKQEVTAGAAIIRQTWLDYRKRVKLRQAVDASTAKQHRIRTHMLKALDRDTGERFARWKTYTRFMQHVKLMGGVHVQDRLRMRLQRWKAFVRLAHIQRREAAVRLQAFARTAEAKKVLASLRRERRARMLVASQARVHIAVVHFKKYRRRMARLEEQVDAFRKEREHAASLQLLDTWRRHSRWHRMARTKVLGMTRRREAQRLRGVVRAWRDTSSAIVRQRREREEAAAEEAARREYSATLAQAVWRSHNARKGFDDRLRHRRAAVCIQKRWRGYQFRKTFHTMAELHHGAISMQRIVRGHQVRSRYTMLFLGEAMRAASSGRFERLFWLTDRWPAAVHQAPSAWYGVGEANESVLHLACRATAHRCVKLCLQREADVRAVTTDGLTPLHCLALYNARTGQERSSGQNALNSPTNPPSTSTLCLPPPSPPLATTSPNSESTAALQRLSAPSATPPTAAPAVAAATAAAKAASTTTDVAAAAEREQGELALREEQRRLSVESSVRAIAGMLFRAGADEDAADNEGNTPLLTAASTGGGALCELLLTRGTNADARNHAGLSALLLAVLGDAPDCVEALLNAGANPNESRSDGTTALHSAAGKGVSQVMICLMKHGAQLDVADGSGRTPLMHAVIANHGTAAALLCDFGANLELTDSSGQTALHLASQDGQIEALSELLERSIDVDARDDQKNTGLHIAAYSRKDGLVQALLESGADPNLQNVRGDNPAHVAARGGHLKVVETLVAYDVRIGQRNWKELTPFGEARMNNHTEVADFLSASFTRIGKPPDSVGNTCIESVEARDQTGSLVGSLNEQAWDKEVEEKAIGWEQTWDEDSQRFYYFRRDTWESTFSAPFKISSSRVEELREGSEVAYQRRVAAVKGESLVGISDYREAFQEDRAELDMRRGRHEAATVIQAAWRARSARQEVERLGLRQRSAITIQRVVRHFLARHRRDCWAGTMAAVLVIQRHIRGYRARREHRQSLLELEGMRSEKRLNHVVARLYRGYAYGRKLARKIRAKRAAAFWEGQEWEAALDDAGGPGNALRTFCGHTGQWEVYRLRGSPDVTFYRNLGTYEYGWDQPEEWRAQDERDFHTREHTRIYGFTAEEYRAAVLIQNAWRGKMARDHCRHLLRAQRICKGAEAAYLADPDSLRHQINYILFTHVIEKDYGRARLLYRKALRAMEERGPDVQLLLFAFGVFCLVTGDENMTSIISTVERAIAAPSTASGADSGRRPWPPVTFTSTRSPKAFALAEAGFFRFAAYRVNDSESWHNYAACRQLVYGDFHGATERYLEAIERDPKNAKAQTNYQILLDTFPEHSQGRSTYESLSAHHALQAESEKRRKDLSSANFLRRPEVVQAALKIQRAWMRSKQDHIHAFGSYLDPTARLLRDVQEEALALQRETRTSSTGSKPRSAAWKSEEPEPLRSAKSTRITSPSTDDRCRQDLSTTALSSSRSSSSRMLLPEPSVSNPGSVCDSALAQSSLSTITAGTRTARETTRDGDGNEDFFNASPSRETRGDDPPDRRDSHDNTRIDVGGDNPIHSYRSCSQTRGDLAAHARNRKVAKLNGTDNSAVGSVAEGVLQPSAGKQSAGGATEVEEEEEKEEENEEEEEEEEEEESAYSAPLLPSGWEAVVADDDGSVFYHHISSGVTQWEVPQQQARESTGAD